MILTFLLNPQGMTVLRLIFPSPSFGLTRGDVFHPPLLPAGSTALTGDVAQRSPPGGALPSVPSAHPPLPPPQQWQWQAPLFTLGDSGPVT